MLLGFTIHGNNSNRGKIIHFSPCPFDLLYGFQCLGDLHHGCKFESYNHGLILGNGHSTQVRVKRIDGVCRVSLN